jgi:hypothetical protein
MSAKPTAAFGAGLTVAANTRARVSAITGRDKIDMVSSVVRGGYLACNGPANDFFNAPGATRGSRAARSRRVNVVGRRVSSTSIRVPVASGVSWKTQPPPGPKTFESWVVTVTRRRCRSH